MARTKKPQRLWSSAERWQIGIGAVGTFATIVAVVAQLFQ